MNAVEWSVILGTGVLIMGFCNDAAAQGAPPYQFNGIVLDSLETDLPKAYKAVIQESDCRPDRLGQKPVKHCSKTFSPHALPGVPSDVKGPVHFSVNYVEGRLQQIGFGLRREDYAAFVAALIKEHGAPQTARSVLMDSVNENEYTWNRGQYSIATYAFGRDTATSTVLYSVIAPVDHQLLERLGVKPRSKRQ